MNQAKAPILTFAGLGLACTISGCFAGRNVVVTFMDFCQAIKKHNKSNLLISF